VPGLPDSGSGWTLGCRSGRDRIPPGETRDPKPSDRRVTPPTAELDRTAVSGPVCPVVWEGRSREAPPYPAQPTLSVRASRQLQVITCATGWVTRSAWQGQPVYRRPKGRKGGSNRLESKAAGSWSQPGDRAARPAWQGQSWIAWSPILSGW